MFGTVVIFYPSNDDMIVTQFETNYARRVFPCFDDPYFQSKFKLSIQIPAGAAPKVDTVLSNMPVEKFYEAERIYIFQETIHPIPAYLVAFALLDSKRYPVLLKMEYFGTPINCYVAVRNSDEERFLQNIKYIESVIKLTLTTCEQIFASKFDWPKLDFLLTDLQAGGMENPGLITVNANSDLSFFLVKVRAGVFDRGLLTNQSRINRTCIKHYFKG